MATVPDVLSWLSITSASEAITGDDGELSRVLDAVTEDIMGQCIPFANGVPSPVEQAIVMATARLWKRKGTPEGVMIFGPDGVIRVGAFDADVEKLLGSYNAFNVG